ncbi:hypothetical protein Cva_00841 [Caedimonas varicaedens]|uniref:Uncharacterized protein n=1 Tax=Caedimonas varicaedens TaxID=1629334 RepID=A0A0K8MD96_9PROT|nr:hypothetical protein Cva_00841 [Caedimonas varicaedens]
MSKKQHVKSRLMPADIPVREIKRELTQEEIFALFNEQMDVEKGDACVLFKADGTFMVHTADEEENWEAAASYGAFMANVLPFIMAYPDILKQVMRLYLAEHAVDVQRDLFLHFVTSEETKN